MKHCNRNDYSKSFREKSSAQGSPLRQRMRQDMVLHNLSEKTQASYIAGVLKLARYYNCSPADLCEEQLRDFFLFLKCQSGLSPDTIRVIFYGIKFLYQKTLGRNWKIFDVTKVPQPKHLPVVLSFEEVQRILSHITHPMYRMMLTLTYACGLRFSECVNLRVEDIDGSRMVVRVKGKGNKYRNVPLPKHILHLLRSYWHQACPTPLLFPSTKTGGLVSHSTIRCAFRDACKKAKINKKATIHTLRHSYATHLLENGVEFRIIQGVLGHRSARSTIRYTHLTDKTDQALNKAVTNQMSKL